MAPWEASSLLYFFCLQVENSRCRGETQAQTCTTKFPRERTPEVFLKVLTAQRLSETWPAGTPCVQAQGYTPSGHWDTCHSWVHACSEGAGSWQLFRGRPFCNPLFLWMRHRKAEFAHWTWRNPDWVLCCLTGHSSQGVFLWISFHSVLVPSHSFWDAWMNYSWFFPSRGGVSTISLLNLVPAIFCFV